MIPKIVHQMWRDYDIPKKYKILGNYIKKENEDYKYYFWTDDTCVNLVKQNYPFLEKHLL